MTKIYLVRHGKTEWNQQSRFQGSSDILLSTQGREQASALKKRLSKIVFQSIYCSDLLRAFDTARIISEDQSADPISDPRLQELNFGKWEGLTYDKIKEKNPQELLEWESDHWRVAPPGGEKLSALSNRVSDFLNSIITEYIDSPILIVAHGGTLQTMICYLLNHPQDIKDDKIFR